MAVVDYKVAGSIEEAVGFLSNAKIPTRILAGGTDLIIQSKAQANPIAVVDVKKIDSMMAAVIDDSGLTLGPSMSCAEFTHRDDIKALFPGLVESAYLIGSTQVQGRCSIGGNLCNSSPAADTVPALIVNGA
ncbi:MAG: carbon-monoxide dehydrogenase medium subunit, partial [Candidatus Azotimanducaceae bacterium]